MREAARGLLIREELIVPRLILKFASSRQQRNGAEAEVPRRARGRRALHYQPEHQPSALAW